MIPITAGNKSVTAALFTILLAGLMIRICDIDFGLPSLYDPDEPIFVLRALKILRDRDLNPGWFGHPGTTTIYMLSMMYALIYAVGRMLGIFSDAGGFADYIRADSSLLYLSGRLLILVFAIASLYVIFVIGRRIFGRWVGILGAALLAISPVHVHYSQLIRTDVQLGFLALLTVLFSLRISEYGRWRDYALAGVMIGLSIATKWPGVVLLLVVIAAHYSSVRLSKQRLDEAFSKLLLAGALALLSLFLVSPFIFLDFATVLQDVARESHTNHLSANGHGFLGNLWWYLTVPIVSSTSGVGLLLALFGIAYSCYRDTRHSVVLLAFPLAFILFIPALALRWERWIVPILPFVGLYAAAGIFALAKVGGSMVHRYSREAAVVSGVLLTMAIAIPLASNIKARATELRNDTRAATGAWLLKNIPKGSRLLMEAYTPQLPLGTYEFFGVTGGGSIERAGVSSWNPFQPIGQLGNLKEFGELRRQHIDYLVLSNWFERYTAEAALYPEAVMNYRAIFANSTEIYRIDPLSGRMGGPTIRVLEVPTDSGSVTPRPRQ